jgi:NADPH:quinone reductase-like Zn-dependent oxidoreductase
MTLATDAEHLGGGIVDPEGGQVVEAAQRAVFGDRPVGGSTVLVHGVLGGPGVLDAQIVHWGGATVIGTVRQHGDLERVNASAVAHAVALDQPDPSAAIRAGAPDGAAKQQAAADLTTAARGGALSIPVDASMPLEQVAEAHERVDAGTRGRVLLTIPD